jgi:hypothetical protein
MPLFSSPLFSFFDDFADAADYFIDATLRHYAAIRTPLPLIIFDIDIDAIRHYSPLFSIFDATLIIFLSLLIFSLLFSYFRQLSFSHYAMILIFQAIRISIFANARIQLAITPFRYANRDTT